MWSYVEVLIYGQQHTYGTKRGRAFSMFLHKLLLVYVRTCKNSLVAN